MLFSFPPLVSPQSRVLILGSLPGAESLRKQQYYAHPRNAFWPIVYTIFRRETDGDYARRCAFILANRLALWDVCGSAERVGSADATLANIEPNDIAGLLRGFPNIRRIVLNGRKAETEYLKHFKSLDVPAVYAPSTSPALAMLSFDEKLAAWRSAVKLT
jgi:hypoxanthine-DNA glycosylase